MTRALFLFSILLLAACRQKNDQHEEQLTPKDTTAAAPDTAHQLKSLADGEMKTYYMVFLNKGPHRDQDSVTAGQLQEQHLAHLTKMYNDKKLLIAGPFLDEGTAVGVCVYNVSSADEARKLAEQDPSVKAGRLVVEVRPWMTLKSSVE